MGILKGAAKAQARDDAKEKPPPKSWLTKAEKKMLDNLTRK